ncbi:basic amino acid ABC transporter substrate-binding protein [Calderihabitans maritimus]|uniref:Basic amino acid ABC transporter substrate-binding protein n=1 Tax=Calderihabitans maritimus TaxID=1246530 RepID=A0A1Z5HV33_9FIRM|nr:basic amino acid ABC transporter substrate-binding protein [Calderihabitans maritimus]GAW93150.1 hypothetical protein KKC1_22910 [Calderihabitans maritimus]
MKKVGIALLVALLVFGLMVAVTGCGAGGEKAGKEESGANTEQTQPGEGGEKEVAILKVGTEAAYAPFEYVDEKTGEITGFDAELIKAIAEAIGMEAELQHIDWDGLYPALNSGEVDVVISAMTITPEREEEVDFSEPYFEVVQAIAVKEGSEIRSLADLVGKRVGVQANTTGHYAVEQIEGMKEDDISTYPTTPDALMALETGEVEAVVADDPVVANFIKHNPDAGIVMIEDPTVEPEFYGIALKEGNPLREKINEGLKKVKESGKYDEIYAKYFGK